ncbi:MAG: transposase [Myxococcaceae bacterium]
MVEVIGGVLARATQKYPVQLCGFVAASNHVHLLCRAQDGALSKFMQYVLGNITRKAGRLVGWRGQLWERRFSAEQVLDPSALEGRLKYIISHGVKEGLVERVLDWPGLSCVPQLLNNAKRTFRFFEWSRRWARGQLLGGGEQPWIRRWTTEETLELHPIETWEHWSPEARRARVRQLMAEAEAEGREKYPDGPRGLTAVLSKNPLRRPRATKRSPRPWFHAFTQALRDLFKAKYDQFVRDFRVAAALFRTARWAEAEFPPYAFRPIVQSLPRRL